MARHCLAQGEETVSKKKDKNSDPDERNPMTDEGDLDWKPLYSALRDSIEWALDIAAKLAAPYPEEVEAIENVRAFVRAKLAGEEAQVRLVDVMLTFGIIVAAIETDLGPQSRVLLSPMHSVVTNSMASLPRVIRIPAASELWERSVTQHCPGAQAVPTRRAPHVRYVA
jgi:hypothetical protein